MRYLKLAILFASFFTVLSCKKDKDPADDPKPEPVSYPNYFPLKVGNYWVYQLFEIDSSENETALNQFNTVTVTRDTVINNSTYFVLETKGSYNIKPKIYLKDSLHYIVNEKGEIQFSSQDFTNVLRTEREMFDENEEVLHTVFKMEDVENEIIVEAGSFKTLAFKGTYYISPRFSYGRSIRYTFVNYAEGVGVVKERYISSPYGAVANERRLLRYKVN